MDSETAALRTIVFFFLFATVDPRPVVRQGPWPTAVNQEFQKELLLLSVTGDWKPAATIARTKWNNNNNSNSNNNSNNNSNSNSNNN